MGDHVQGEEVFEIQDFSVASPFEAISASIEDAVRAWIEAPPADGNDRQVEVSEEGGPSYTLFLHGCPSQAREFMQEMLSDATDFQTPPFSELPVDRLRRWFGLTAFVLLTPNDDEEIGGDELARLMGALNVALMSVGRAVPAFVLHDSPRCHIYGRGFTMVNGNAGRLMGCRFDVQRFSAHTVPKQLLMPMGVVNLFRAKLTDDSDEIEPSITIRCRQTYLLAEFAQWEQLQDIGPFDLQLPLAESATDPLPLLTLAAQWSTSDDAFESLETLPHPSSAPVWTVRAQPPLQPTRTPKVASALASCIGGMLSSLGSCAAACERIPTASLSVDHVLRVMEQDGCVLLGDDGVQELLDTVVREESASSAEGRPTYWLLERMCLAVARHSATHSHKARVHSGCILLQLWKGVLADVRRRWDVGQTSLPHVTHAQLTSVELQQSCEGGSKRDDATRSTRLLQLISLCMNQRKEREREDAWERRREEWRAAKSASSAATLVDIADEEDNGDARAAARLAIANAQAAAMAATEGAHSSTNGGTGRVGALSPIPGLIGLQSGQPLHKPVLQPAGPIGEATLDELRTRSAPSSLVTKRMKADMQAFKAANPGCVLEDFVRWYSPSDWLSQSAEGGDNLSGRERLSERFCRDGGLESTLWDATLPVPAAQQRPLFDAAREANEAIDQLEATPPTELLLDFARLTVEAVIAALRDSTLLSKSPHSALLQHALATRCTELHARGAPPSEWQLTVTDALSRLELELQRVSSLHSKFPGMSALQQRLLTDLDRDVVVHDDERPRIQQHLVQRGRWNPGSASYRPEPDQVELLLKAEAARPPVAGAAACAHRMFVARNGDHWRLAIALGADHNVG